MSRSRIFPAFLFLLALLFPFGPLAAQTRELHIAAASDLQPVLPVLARDFEQETGIHLELSFGSSATLATQILNGAPMDVFLSADFLFPEKIVAAELAEEKAPEPYAKGTLVLWARKDSPIKPLTLDKLADPQVTRIAVADELHAPYGRAAYAAMRSMKTLDALKPKLVVAENIAQTGQFIDSGNAQMGFISLTMASQQHYKEIGDYVLVPKVYPEIQQCGVVMKGSKNLADAKTFMAWMRSPKVQNRLKDFGLAPAL
ncbi:molybdate ABC transporter substrate-binding protein [Granulicella sp. WH15]|uniref:molybdate ABC transporter substrate-binding protein n=1 Tax=Granulicella sp. WH15 TaxID=2602070 RepID=UPI001366B02F|nr:molybdate ABC transporter substrate-binding protein [Granulicella sp. WH15]QHN04010.1 molybdate ABC transporter substrate-binding protein [Granulicella sp. WH15]